MNEKLTSSFRLVVVAVVGFVRGPNERRGCAAEGSLMLVLRRHGVKGQSFEIEVVKLIQ